MSVILFAKSVLEDTGAAIATTTTAAGFGKERLSDRDRGLLCKANAAGQFDVDITLSPADTASALAIVNHNVGANVQIYADTASAIGTTLIATVSPAGIDPFFGTFTLQSQTKYRIRFLSFGSALQVGELLLGVPRTIAQNPFIRQSAKHTLGNVARDRSPGGYLWATRKGTARIRLPYGWVAMPAADLAILEAAYGELSEGAKNLLIKDVSDVYRWMSWMDESLEPVPVDRNAGEGVLSEVQAIFEEAL